MKTMFTLLALVAGLMTAIPAHAEFKNQINYAKYVYDFSVDGGATGSISLSSKAGYRGLPASAIVTRVFARVVTACTSGGSATVEWGNTADTDGYSGTANAVAGLTADSVWNGSETAGGEGALIWFRKATTPALATPKVYQVTSTANTKDFLVKINTAALTAGKIIFYVEYFMPSL